MRIAVRSTYVIALGILAAACAPKQEQAAPPPAVITVSDSAIKTPESVIFDAAGDMYFVSNINGTPLAKDNNGFISHVMPGGMVHEAHWIQGGAKGVTLNAPKGMGIKGDSLFVADIDVVRVFNRETGAPLTTLTIKGATFLNDVAVGPDGTVYVTDSGLDAAFKPTGADALYRFGPKGAAIAVTKGADMGGPNGITVTPDGIVVVSFGPGGVYRVDPKTGARSAMPKPPKGGLDGVEMLADGSLIISSWEGSAIYRLSNGVYTTAVDSIVSPADIGYDRKRQMVLVPMMNANQIQIREVR
ncbi:MAG: hypothetical protein EXR93_12330 [Gemmatimonadetes bacterium]|nr:hypothetical protein [Gemmatimonadota bacterium]